MSIKSIAPQIVSCHVMHGRPQFLFSSRMPCSARFALMESSLQWHALHMTNTTVILFLLWFPTRLVLLFSLLLVASCQVIFSILLKPNAVVSFNCRPVTVTCCNSTATYAPVFSLAAKIHALLYTNLQAKFLKIQGLKSLNAAAAGHIVTSRQSVI